jgi:hypothetical protein
MGLLDPPASSDDGATVQSSAAPLRCSLFGSVPGFGPGLLYSGTGVEYAIDQVRSTANYLRSIGESEKAEDLDRTAERLAGKKLGAPPEWTEYEKAALTSDILKLVNNNGWSVRRSCMVLLKKDPWRSKTVRSKPITPSSMMTVYHRFLNEHGVNKAHLKAQLKARQRGEVR